MKAETYRAVRELLTHLDGWNPPVRARLIAEVRELIEEEANPYHRSVSENPYHQACAGCMTKSKEDSGGPA
jgi:hypothetical protein